MTSAPVRHAVLAILAERELTGFQVFDHFERLVGEFWQMNAGQLYSTLKRLCETRMLASQAIGKSARGETRRYRLLPAGRAALDVWMHEAATTVTPARDPLYVKLAISRPEHAPALLRHVTDELARYRDVVATLRALTAHQPRAHGARMRWLVADGMRRTHEAHLAWLETVRDALAVRDVQRGAA